MTSIKVVLDTNIVLDWLIFNDPAVNAIAEGVHANQITVLTHSPAIDELRRVLTYAQFKLDELDREEALAAYLAMSSTVSLPEHFSRTNLLLPAGFPRCRDRDDQHFLALCFHAKADALVSRDNAVLRLQGRAEKFGVRIFSLPQLIALLRPD